jgi:predicted nucleic acid-binding protein
VSTRYLVDTNVLLRFLSGEPVPQAEAARKLFADAASGEAVLDVSPVIVAEAMYTLVSFYEVERKEAADKLLVLRRRRGVKVRDASQVFSALERLRTVNVGFADAFLAAGGVEEKVAVASFDRDLEKFKDVTRYEPRYKNTRGGRVHEFSGHLRELHLAQTRKKIQAGLDELDRGEGIPGEQVYAQMKEKSDAFRKAKR